MAPLPVSRKTEYLPKGPVQDKKKSTLYPAVTISWMDWLLEKGEPDSNWYDFAEERPIWTKWWFRICAGALCVGFVWLFWPIL